MKALRLSRNTKGMKMFSLEYFPCDSLIFCEYYSLGFQNPKRLKQFKESQTSRLNVSSFHKKQRVFSLT